MNIKLPSTEMKFLYQRILIYLVEDVDDTYVHYNGPRLSNQTGFWKFILYVTRQLMDHKCQNMSIYSRILSLCCRVAFWGLYRISKELIPLTQWILHLADREVFDNIADGMSPNSLEKLLTTPYKFAHTVVSYKNCDAVGGAASNGNVGLLEVLLKFGAVLLKPPDHPHEVAIEWIEAHKFLCPQNFWLNSELHTAYCDLIDILEILDEHQRRRMFLVARVLQSVGKIRYRPRDAHMHAAALKLLFMSIPEPKVTSREIEKKIDLAGNIPHRKVIAICERFEEFFPEGRELPSPRSLKHLSRCQVRDNLRLAKSLPTGVDSLPVPNKLKAYILLKEERYFESNPIVATQNYIHYRVTAITAGRVLCYVPKDY